MLDARGVGRMGTMQIAVRTRARIEFDQVAALQHQVDQRVVFGFGTITPMHILGLGQAHDIVGPAFE